MPHADKKLKAVFTQSAFQASLAILWLLCVHLLLSLVFVILCRRSAQSGFSIVETYHAGCPGGRGQTACAVQCALIQTEITLA